MSLIMKNNFLPSLKTKEEKNTFKYVDTTVILPLCIYNVRLAVVSVVHSPALKDTKSVKWYAKTSHLLLVNCGISVRNVALNCQLLNATQSYTSVASGCVPVVPNSS